MAKLKALSTDCLITDWAYIACLWCTKKKKRDVSNTHSQCSWFVFRCKKPNGSTILTLLINLPLAIRKHFKKSRGECYFSTSIERIFLDIYWFLLKWYSEIAQLWSYPWLLPINTINICKKAPISLNSSVLQTWHIHSPKSIWIIRSTIQVNSWRI